MHLSWVYTCSPSWSPLHLSLHTIPLGHPSAPAPSILYPALNLDWRFVSYMILYMFQCHSPKTSHPRPLPQSPKDCSIHLCLFCCLAYRVIITIFLNSIYMISILYWCFSFWLTSLCIIFLYPRISSIYTGICSMNTWKVCISCCWVECSINVN